MENWWSRRWKILVGADGITKTLVGAHRKKGGDDGRCAYHCANEKCGRGMPTTEIHKGNRLAMRLVGCLPCCMPCYPQMDEEAIDQLAETNKLARS